MVNTYVDQLEADNINSVKHAGEVLKTMALDWIRIGTFQGTLKKEYPGAPSEEKQSDNFQGD